MTKQSRTDYHRVGKLVKQGSSYTTLQGVYREIATEAVKEGVIIHTHPIYPPNNKVKYTSLLNEVTFEDLKGIVGGHLELLEIPSAKVGSAPTLLVVNEEGRLLNLVSNSIASYLFCQELVGEVIWLPRLKLQRILASQAHNNLTKGS